MLQTKEREKARGNVVHEIHSDSAPHTSTLFSSSKVQARAWDVSVGKKRIFEGLPSHIMEARNDYLNENFRPSSTSAKHNE